MTDSANTLCSAFWKHTNIRPNNEIFPCCRFKVPVQKFNGSIGDILHSDSYNELRQKSLNGVEIEGCSKCYYEESIGVYSLRNWFNDHYTPDSVKLEFLEVGFDNICNLACDGCNENFSSSWAKKLNVDKDKIIRTTVEFDTIPDTVKKVLFLGGEPLMTSRHLKLLTKMSNKERIEIEYNTNGTFLLDDVVINELKQFENVKFVLSVDGYGKLNNTVRSGSKWEDIIAFIYQIKNLNFELEINSVIHMNNWHGIKDLAEFNNSLGVTWNCRLLTYPLHLDIKHLNESQKTELAKLVNSVYIPSGEKILRHINR